MAKIIGAVRLKEERLIFFNIIHDLKATLKNSHRLSTVQLNSIHETLLIAYGKVSNFLQTSAQLQEIEQKYNTFCSYFDAREFYFIDVVSHIDRELYKKKVQSEEVTLKQKSSIIATFVKNENADNSLYYFSFIFKDKKYYKLGITSQTLKERYGKDFKKIEKLFYNEKIDGAIKIEKELKHKFKDDVFPLKYFNEGGHTEIFDKDILELDIKNKSQ